MKIIFCFGNMLYIASDHAGFELKEEIKNRLQSSGQEITDLVPTYDENDDYPLIARELAYALSKGNSTDFGIAICGTGIGICIALNRFKKVRAGLVNTPEMAQMLRKHNHGNVLCLAGKFVGIEDALLIINDFLNTKPDESPRHVRRVEQLGE